MSRLSRIELLLFFTCFFAFAYFNQGGGWNQNARFAEVRALAEQGRFAINDYLIYKTNAEGTDLVRIPVDHAEYTYEGERHRLCWVDSIWTLEPVGDRPLGEGVKKDPMFMVCSSGDIGYVPKTGEFHPNKPPGTTLLAVPGYFVIYHLERWLGVNPDSWWYLNLNAWLASVFSVGLISAVGCVLFFRLACELGGGAVLPALLATFAFAFGTTFFPFSTILFDHDLTASLLLAAYFCLRRTLSARPARLLSAPALLAGCLGGVAVLTNYPAVLGVFALGLYALLTGGVNWRRAFGFCVGGIGPAVVLCLCTWACYGGPFKLSNDFQNPLFGESDAFLGMFVIPKTPQEFWLTYYVGKLILYLPFRGVFFFAPVLLMSLAGLVLWLREKRVGDAFLCAGIFGLFFLLNLLFNGYHGGFSAGPRYLIPGLPFFALPLVAAFRKWPKITGALAAVSIAFNLLLTATDAQNPTGVGGHTRVEGRHGFESYNLLTEYAWPLFAHGRANSLIAEQTEAEMQKRRIYYAGEIKDPAVKAQREKEWRDELQAAFSAGREPPYYLGGIRGPVSVNPIGVYEGSFKDPDAQPESAMCRWASFNLGEFLWPESRWSLLPLVVVCGALAALGIMLARRETLEPGQTWDI